MAIFYFRVQIQYMYDIIGDVHGYANILKNLLLKLGYKKTTDGYSHPERKVVFVGDFINRGPQIRKSMKIVRKMVENGNALAILGNHELNALIVDSKNKKDAPLVKNPPKNFLSVFKTLGEFSSKTDEWNSYMKWMRTLPLFIETEQLRFVHACWANDAITYLKENLPPGKIKRKVFRDLYKNPDSELSRNIWLVTKGVYFKMPGDMKIKNNKGVSPQSFRTRWWENPAGKTFQELSFESKYELPGYTVPEQILPDYYSYEENEPLLFFGHYCRGNGPFIIRSNICCLDSCVTGKKTLTAYRWQGEKELTEEHLVQAKL